MHICAYCESPIGDEETFQTIDEGRIHENPYACVKALAARVALLEST